MKDNDKRYKYGRRIIKSTQIGRTLDYFKKLYLEKDKPDYLVIPYILTCSAYLESKLNDAFCDLDKQYGEDFSTAMQSLSLPSKLKVLVPILTNGKFEINKNHLVFQRLTSLIRVRNSITHAKSEMEETEATEEELVNVPLLGAGIAKWPKKFIYDSPDMTLGASKTFTPLEYHEAIEKLEKYFFRRLPDRLNKVSMVRDRSQTQGWEDNGKMFVKTLD